MIESPLAFHALESPAPGARVRGPLVWLTGWLVAKPGFAFVDLRVRSAHGAALGVLGLPRVDLAQHFRSPRPWLPAGFVVGVELPDGDATLHLEAQDQHGNWIGLQTLALTVAPDGAGHARTEGAVAAGATVRGPHLPFHGHLDEPGAAPTLKHGQVPIFGWLLHESAPLARVLATLDGLTFWPLDHSLSDESLAQKVALPAARHARLRGLVPAPVTLAAPALLRVYAELADGSAHLCFAQRLAPAADAPRAPAADATPLPHAHLPALPSGRPRRALFAVRSLRPDEATLRALDVARFLRGTGRWAVRLVATEDGALRDAFEAADCPVQLVAVDDYVNSTGAAAEAALAQLDRQLWWRHLDGVAVFDDVSAWVGRLAAQRGVPVFADPAATLAWFSPDTSALRYEPAAPIVAPIRGLAAHGGALLVAAFAGDETGGAVVLTDLRDHAEEQLLRAALPQAPRVQVGEWTGAASALVCPAFADWPQHRLLAAAAAGVPVITTLPPLLATTFTRLEFSIVAPGNPLALAHALRDLAADPASARRRAAGAMRAVLAAHDPAVLLPRWLGAFEAAARR